MSDRSRPRNGQSDGQEALAQLQAFLAAKEYPLNTRLPPERSLCAELGVNRTALRKALAVLEAEGQIWRHVGRGTFIGTRPLDNINDVGFISRRTNPAEVMEARLLIEPELARLAALSATSADIAEMEHCIRKSKAASEWRIYEAWDNKLHRAIAQATRNNLLLALFDTLNMVRRATVWGRLRTAKPTPDPGHHSFAEHDALVAAIANRDMDLAAACMRRHLEMVRRKLLGSAENGG